MDGLEPLELHGKFINWLIPPPEVNSKSRDRVSNATVLEPESYSKGGVWKEP